MSAKAVTFQDPLETAPAAPAPLPFLTLLLPATTGEQRPWDSHSLSSALRNSCEGEGPAEPGNRGQNACPAEPGNRGQNACPAEPGNRGTGHRGQNACPAEPGNRGQNACPAEPGHRGTGHRGQNACPAEPGNRGQNEAWVVVAVRSPHPRRACLATLLRATRARRPKPRPKVLVGAVPESAGSSGDGVGMRLWVVEDDASLRAALAEGVTRFAAVHAVEPLDEAAALSSSSSGSSCVVAPSTPSPSTPSPALSCGDEGTGEKKEPGESLDGIVRVPPPSKRARGDLVVFPFPSSTDEAGGGGGGGGGDGDGNDRGGTGDGPAHPPASYLVARSSDVESEALEQLLAVASLPGVTRAAGMPDLHPGRGHPIGAAIASRGVIFPSLVGSDIGCGMLLVRTAIHGSPGAGKTRRWARNLDGLEGRWSQGCPLEWLQRGDWGYDFGDAEDASHDASDDDGAKARGPAGESDAPELSLDSLGTVGRGNHFAELCEVAEIKDDDAARDLGIDPSRLHLLVHSGSRGLGASILNHHENTHGGSSGLAVPTPGDPSPGQADATLPGPSYLAEHDRAVAWGRANRALIARRFLDAVSSHTEHKVLDIVHNSVRWDPTERDWVHRKGAAPADRGAVVIPGSRGAHSYVVLPATPGDDDDDDDRATAASAAAGATAPRARERLRLAVSSLAHGAGRKWSRSKALAMHSARGGGTTRGMEVTSFGSHVICEDKALLAEECPQAYKDIEGVIADLRDAGLARVVAVLRPVITYKVRK